MSSTNTREPAWRPVERAPSELSSGLQGTFEALATGAIPAVIVRGGFGREQCRAVVRRLYDRGGIEEREGTTYDAVGTSLVNRGADPEVFFSHARETHLLYQRLFGELQD